VVCRAFLPFPGEAGPRVWTAADGAESSGGSRCSTSCDKLLRDVGKEGSGRWIGEDEGSFESGGSIDQLGGVDSIEHGPYPPRRQFTDVKASSDDDSPTNTTRECPTPMDRSTSTRRWPGG
jgi:hypothetical protein